MTSDELELAALDISDKLEADGDDDLADTIRQLVVRYRAALITANNYKKALEAMDHAR